MGFYSKNTLIQAGCMTIASVLVALFIIGGICSAIMLFFAATTSQLYAATITIQADHKHYAYGHLYNGRSGAFEVYQLWPGETLICNDPITIMAVSNSDEAIPTASAKWYKNDTRNVTLNIDLDTDDFK